MEDLAFEAINDFLISLPQIITEISSAINSKNALALEISAHSLKGSLSNFYAESSMIIAWKLEQMGHCNDMNAADLILNDLNLELQKFELELRSLLNDRN